MDKTPSQVLKAEGSKKSSSSIPHSTKHLPKFPDEDTTAQWIWPPFAGRNILENVFKYALRPRLQSDGTWIINAKNDWRCFSKSHWLYPSADKAQDALRANMCMHLQCSPLLSEQRCVAVAANIKNTWRLWQIVHIETTLAKDLEKALQENELDKLALKTLICATRYADALQKYIHYPPLLNLTLENLGIDAEQQLVYLNYVDDNVTNIVQPRTKATFIDTIKQAFADPITKARLHDVASMVNAFEQIEAVEQQYLVELLIQLFHKE
ncbi:hypothetical protein [Candidatus Parabeggiatoa sp. HSG14]|uniref:hypothetical protein n=1 Tax=Candidatus Parabeggiatoa sp. HSG14 TaxID=3055593 RepID=UPI0025A77168|nr:hypothetical protein [Thiotrichales bacterium HSG14]